MHQPRGQQDLETLTSSRTNKTIPRLRSWDYCIHQLFIVKICAMALCNCLLKFSSLQEAMSYYIDERHFKAGGELVGEVPVVVYIEDERRIIFAEWMQTADHVPVEIMK